MVLLVVDTQKALVNDELYNCNEFIDNIQLLIKKARGSMSILWTQKVELFSQHNICRENYFLGC